MYVLNSKSFQNAVSVSVDYCLDGRPCPTRGHVTVSAYSTRPGVRMSWMEARAVCNAIALKRSGKLLPLTKTLAEYFGTFLENDAGYWIPLSAWRWKGNGKKSQRP